MRNFIFLIAFFCSSVFATQIPVPESPRYVNDLTGTLTNSEVNTLTNQIKALTQKNHAQLVVLVVDTTGDETIEQYATRVFDSWKPGDKDRDDGVLLLVAWQDHTVRIEIGYGLEGIITDAQSGKIIRNSIIPAFKKGDLAGGLQKGINDIESRLTGNNSATITPTDHPLPFSGWWALGDNTDVYFCQRIYQNVGSNLLRSHCTGLCFTYSRFQRKLGSTHNITLLRHTVSGSCHRFYPLRQKGSGFDA